MSIKKTKLSLVALLMLGISSIAQAVAPGAYLGIQAGMTNTNNKTINFSNGLIPPSSVPTSPSNTGFGFRIYLGNNLNKYWGIEAGLARYAASTYNPNVFWIAGKPQIHTAAFDLVGKGTMPIGPISAFLKAGMAVMFTGSAGSIVQSSTNSNGVGASNSTTIHPTIAVGGSFDLTQNWVIEVTGSRVFSNTNVPAADMISLGFSYHFVDEYCGQFLC